MIIEYLHYIVLGLIQGLTEFLPVSSAAHLILIPRLLDWQDQGLAVDVAAHAGTLFAVIFYFRLDLKQLLGNWYNSGFSLANEQSRYVWYLIVATVPVAVVGLLTSGVVEKYLRDPLVIAAATIFFGLILWWADYSGGKTRNDSGLKWKDVLVIGASQVLALVPGTSRSGITISAGLLLGLDRRSATRFAFLLSIPVILLAGSYEFYKLLSSTAAVDWVAVIIVTLISAVTAVLTIHYFLRFLNSTGMLPYVLYRLLLGGFLIYLFV
jgi:undecaprenyl-diphosphatase